MGRPKKKSNAGRPTVMTPGVLAKLEYAFSIDATIEEACGVANISEASYYDYAKITPEFRERVKQLRNEPILAARDRVTKGIKETYSNAMDYLKRKRKAEFGDSSEVTVRVPKPIDDIFQDIGISEDKEPQE